MVPRILAGDQRGGQDAARMERVTAYERVLHPAADAAGVQAACGESPGDVGAVRTPT